MCLGAIYWDRPARVFFGATAREAAAAGFDDSFIYEQIRLAPSTRHIPMEPLLGSEALQAFDEWNRAQSKILHFDEGRSPAIERRGEELGFIVPGDREG